MIEVTRPNSVRFILNEDLIQTAEATPDTVLTLVNGDKVVVSESPAEIVERIVAFRQRVGHGHPVGAVVGAIAPTPRDRRRS